MVLDKKRLSLISEIDILGIVLKKLKTDMKTLKKKNPDLLEKTFAMF